MVRGGQMRSGEVRGGQESSEEVTGGQRRSDEVTGGHRGSRGGQRSEGQRVKRRSEEVRGSY
jgi:hypothetical protein